jgi:1,2-diacylglycerol-3-alpha-glucose alpha-1,2-galactosyltransferase
MIKLMQTAPDNILFVGKLDRRKVVEYYHAADLFFFPSAHETFGMAIIEAAAAGLPLLLRDLSQYRKTFSGAYLEGDEASFPGLIDKFARDKALRLYWQNRAKSLVFSYNSEVGVDRLMQTYHTILCS